MKRFLLALLSCGMYASVFAQPEVLKKNIESSDKWVITPVTNMKGVLGRLDINFPGVERSILIYQPADKFLRSVSRNDKTYPIAPGEYRFTLTNVPVDNVPIQKGHETRLKAGYLDIVSEGMWHLYNETKAKAYTSDNKPKKLPLPVGRYQIKLGGQFYPVVIKDGETVEDYSPIEVKDESPVKEASKIQESDAIIKQVNEITEWVISPATIKSGRRLTIRAPKDTTFTVTNPITNQKIKIPVPVQCIAAVTNPSVGIYDLPLPVELPVRNDYKVWLNQIALFNVPIQGGHGNQDKGWFLVITPKTIEAHTGAVDDLEWAEDLIGATPDRIVLNWDLYNKTGYDGQWKLSGKKVGVYALPPGEYSLRRTHPDPMYYDVKYYYRVIIRDGQWTINGERQVNSSGYGATSGDNTNTNKGTSTEKWVITPVPGMKGVLGRLDINFPGVERSILIYQQADNKFLRSVSRNDKTYPIAPGEYRFTLTNVPVDNVPIQKEHETRLKAGYLDIVSEGMWHLYNETKAKAYTSDNKPKKLPLPVGRYQIKLGGQFYPVVIKDGGDGGVLDFPSTPG